MTPALLSLGSALPPHVLAQGDARILARLTGVRNRTYVEAAPGLFLDAARDALAGRPGRQEDPMPQEDPWTTTS